MKVFLLSFVIFTAAVLAMSIGTLFGKRTIKGNCGGLGNIPGAKCAACTGSCDKKRVPEAEIVERHGASVT